MVDLILTATTTTIPRISSALKAIDLRQIPPPLIIGERLNTQGSRKAKQMVLDEDYDGLVDLARKQVEDGAHCLDVCVATTERSDELEFMVNLAKRLSLEIDAPLVIDSTDPQVIEATVRQIPGRPMINSINLEGDGSKFAKLAPLMAHYGLPSIAMCIGPEGMAKTPQQKVDTAALLYETGNKEYGLRAEQFVFDVLTFTLSTGQEEFLDAGNNTLEGIHLVKERLPNSFTTLGLSNISFGLSPPARRAVNSVFLYHAVKAGLDSAIVNAREITPYGEIDPRQRELAENLIFNRDASCLSELISYFEALNSNDGSSTSSTKAVVNEVDPSWPPARRANFRIVNRLKDGIHDDVILAIAEKLGRPDIVRHISKEEDTGDDSNTSASGKYASTKSGATLYIDADQATTHPGAIRTLNEDLLPAMKEVGDKFGAGELILPFVLKSAECMKAAVNELEKYLLKEEGGASKGILVLGTVYGDVHDIGKNLVKTIFQNNGYTVHDLGKQVPLQKFLEKIDEVGPDAVGLSALLVSTSKQMQLFVEHARKNAMNLPILCGGAAINSNYINRIAKQDGIYEPGVFYCNTMFEGLKTMDSLVSDDERPILLSEWKANLEAWDESSSLSSITSSLSQADQDRLPRSKIVPVANPPVPPSIGIPMRLSADHIKMDEVWRLLDKKSLFKLSWGVRGKAGQKSEAEHERLLEQWKERIVREGLFETEIVYGYFSCHSMGRSLLVDNPVWRDGGSNNQEDSVGDTHTNTHDSIILDFPRSANPGHNLCLADYFGKDDIIVLQSVTIGSRVTKMTEQWDKDGKYSDAYYLHGLAVETAEALAEWTNRRIKSELNLDIGGLRYSWGYPSCPDLSQHHLVWKLLRPDKSGMTLTESGQIVPEHSTAALVVHHPGAKYFMLK